MFGLAVLLRIIVYGAVSWFLLAVAWLALPSPSHELMGDPSAHSTAVLKSGRTLTRVYDREHFWVARGVADRQGFAIDYKLSLQDGVLVVGGTAFWLHDSEDATDREGEYGLVDARFGDRDGINPEWFSKADSTLLFWWIHRETAKPTVRVDRTDETNVKVLICEDVKCFDEPLFTLHIPSRDHTFGFKADPHPTSTSPSWTYPVRVVILALIAPIGVVVLAVTSALRPAGAFIYSIGWVLAEILGVGVLILLLSWLLKGRPPPERFFRNQPVIRFVRRFVNSESGLDSQDNPDADHEQPTTRGRHPINNPGDFFRSSAPLDDLLASFSVTRGLTEPIRFRRTPVGPSSSENEDTESTADFGPGSMKNRTGSIKIDLEAALSNARSKSPSGL